MISYTCKKATKIREIGEEGTNRMVMANLHFENEYGFALQTQTNTIIAIQNGTARIIKSPEQLLPEDTTDEKWKMWEGLCKKYPGPPYGVSNKEEFSTFF